MKISYNILIIGAGGTGTFFLKEFGRFLSSINLYEKKAINSICIADGDIVELKNLDRQAFVEDDIGRNKASVMAEILNLTFQLPFVSWPYYITKIEELNSILNASSENQYSIPIIIGCVDNHACRLLCESYFEQNQNCIYFDSANEFETGEIVFAYKFDNIVISPCRSYYFPDIKEGDLRNIDELSCTELNMATPQHIKTNMQAGAQLLAAITGLLTSDVIYPGFTMFNTKNFNSQFYPYRENSRREKEL